MTDEKNRFTYGVMMISTPIRYPHSSGHWSSSRYLHWRNPARVDNTLLQRVSSTRLKR